MIFGQWTATDNSEAFTHAVDAIIGEAQAKFLAQSPWSLAELEPDDDDYDWLCQWADSLDYKTTRAWMRSLTPYKVNEWSVTRQSAFGLIFLFFASEVARRDATEGHLWKYICKVSGETSRFDEDVEGLLFVQGQPTDALKQAIEQAARTFNLRNVFGISGLMNWFDSVFLQFGFTQKGFLERLPFWLAGQATTQSITWLLSGERHSPTFAALWHSLLELRRKNIRPEQFLLKAKNSPWLLPELHSEALKQAIRRPDLGTASGRSAAHASSNLEKPFLVAPMLLWQNTPVPIFVTHFQNLTDQPLDEPHYILSIAGRECATLLRQEDGTYHSTPGGDITLPLVAPTVVASLVRPDGGTVQSQSLTLYDLSDEVTAYRPDGGRIANAWTTPLSPATDLILFLSPDLTLTPSPFRSALSPNGTGRFCHFLPGWTQEVHIRLGDEDFWQPIVARSPITAEPLWARSVGVQWRRSAPEAASGLTVAGPTAWLTVNHPDNSQVDWVRMDGVQLTRFVNPTSGRVAYGPAYLYDGHIERKVWLRLVPDDGEGIPAIVCRTLDTRQAGGEGAMRQTSEGWVPMGHGTRLSVWEARTAPVRLVTPFAWGGFGPRCEFGMIEGKAWIGNAVNSVRPLGRLGGWGSPLELRSRPYNSIGQKILLASEVYDTGDMAAAIVSRNAADFPVLQIRLHELKEPDNDFLVLWWDIDGELFTVPGCDLATANDGSWVCDVPAGATEPLVVALSYAGIRRGAWWRGDWSEHLGRLAEANPTQCASLLRYFKLPLCALDHLLRVQALLQTAPSETLTAWLGDEDLPKGLRHRADLDWNPTLRTLIGTWSPDLVTAKGLVRLLGSEGASLEDRLLLTVDRLTNICPLFAARLVRVYRDELLDRQVRAGQRTQPEVRHILRHICCRLLDLPPAAGDPEFIRRKNMFVDTTAEVLGLGIVNAVDSAFVSSQAGGLVQKAVDVFDGKPILGSHQDNLDTAFATVDPLRRLVAATLVQRLIS